MTSGTESIFAITCTYSKIFPSKKRALEFSHALGPEADLTLIQNDSACPKDEAALLWQTDRREGPPMAHLRRREFIGLLGGAAVWPLAARAQPSTVTIGYLSPRASEVETQFLNEFRRGLSETGHFVGGNLAIEYRWADGEYDRLPALAGDLVRRQVKVIATTGGVQPARAALAATSSIPIVFTSGSDPVKEGLVRSLNRPGGNATGVHVFSVSLGPKRLEILKELMPRATLIAFLVNPTSQIADLQVKEIEQAGRQMGQPIHVLTASTATELEGAFAYLAQLGPVALLMSADLFFQVQREQVVSLAARHSVPVMYEWPEFVAAGGLISYATVRTDAFLQAGIYVGRILNGANPADLPVVQSTRFELAINLGTAKALGLDVPPALLARADVVIE
jgi:putative ABC transport system substrate-binding protein